jgi:Leucine-rich repeat (LRR) protein
LVLGGNNIGNEGAKALAESKNLKSLTVLDLIHNNMVMKVQKR